MDEMKKGREGRKGEGACKERKEKGRKQKRLT